MVLDPFPLLALIRVTFLLQYVVSVFVISHYESIELLSILYAVRVIVILRGCLHYETLISQIVKEWYIIWNLRNLHILEIHWGKFLFSVDLIIVEEVIRKEADYLMTILMPVFNYNLDTQNWEEFTASVSHSSVLSINNNHWFLVNFLIHSGYLINLAEKVLWFLDFFSWVIFIIRTWRRMML